MNWKRASAFEIVRFIDIHPEGETGLCLIIDAEREPSLPVDISLELEIQSAQTLGIVVENGKPVSHLLD